MSDELTSVAIGDTREIEGERAYPVYTMSAKWIEDHDGKYEPIAWQIEGLPKGRLYNSTAVDRMFREPQAKKELVKAARDWWKAYRERKADDNVADPIIVWTFVHWETWCLEWFQHFTFDDGRTDQEYVGSFERYVRRHNGGVCLMGAEDRWRWCGTKAGEPDERTDPPCRCEHCKKAGIVRIGH